MDWCLVLPLLKNGSNRLGLEPQGYGEIVLIKCLLIGQGHGLSDPKLDECLRVQFGFMLLASVDLYYTVLDETTHCRFRNPLVKAGTYDGFLPRYVTR